MHRYFLIQASSIVLAARTRPRSGTEYPRLRKARGTARQKARPVRLCTLPFRRCGASRRAVAAISDPVWRFLVSVPISFRAAAPVRLIALSRLGPSSDRWSGPSPTGSWRRGPSARAGSRAPGARLAKPRASAGPYPTSRRNRSWPLRGFGRKQAYKSYRNIVKKKLSRGRPERYADGGCASDRFLLNHIQGDRTGPR